MQKSITRKALIVLSVLAVIGFATNAFADQGMGYGQRGWNHHGPGRYQEGPHGPGCGYWMNNLSDDEIEKLEMERKSFFNGTKELRQDVYAKGLELKSEFAKKNLDPDKVRKLQKEISDLEGKIDQKRIDHMINMRKINPNIGRNLMDRGGMGYGHMRGGDCWQ